MCVERTLIVAAWSVFTTRSTTRNNMLHQLFLQQSDMTALPADKYGRPLLLIHELCTEHVLYLSLSRRWPVHYAGGQLRANPHSTEPTLAVVRRKYEWRGHSAHECINCAHSYTTQLTECRFFSPIWDELRAHFPCRVQIWQCQWSKHVCLSPPSSIVRSTRIRQGGVEWRKLIMCVW